MTISVDSLPTKIILCTPVWGIDYLETFTRLCIKTLISEYNIPYLSSFINLDYIVYTDEKGREYLFNNPMFIEMKKYVEVDVRVFVINSEISKFKIFNDCYAKVIKDASYSNSAILFINADLMISDRFMEMIYSKIIDGKRCVEIDGFRVVKQNMLEIFRDSKQAISISGENLAKIAIHNMHPVMRAHFWKLCHEYGYSPYHTYWRCWGGKQAGIVGRSAHIGPIYIFPRRYFYKFERTIDWDLVDNSNIKWEEIYHLLDSKYSFCVEVSDINYLSMPAYHYGANIINERYFISRNYNSFNVKNLSLEVVIRGEEGIISLYLAKLRSKIWYLAAVRGLNSAAILDFILGLLFCYTDYLASKIEDLSDLIYLYKNNRYEDIFQILTGMSARQYNEILLKKISEISKNKLLFYLFISKKKFISNLNQINSKFFFDSKSKNLSRIQSGDFKICMHKDYFCGSMWELVKNYPLLSTSRYGNSSVYCEFTDDYMREVEIVICSINPNILQNISIILNDKFKMMYRIHQTDKYILLFHIPRHLLKLTNGQIKLTLQSYNRLVFFSGKALVQAINFQSINKIQNEVLKNRALNTDLYAYYCSLNSEYYDIYTKCSQDVVLSNDLAIDWLENLEQTISKEAQELVSHFPVSNLIDLSAYFVGIGWGDSVNLGRDRYRYLSNDYKATIYCNVWIERKVDFRLYFYNFDRSICQFAISVNDTNINDCEIFYDNGKYFIQGSYVPEGVDPGELMLLKFSIEHVHKNVLINKIPVVKRFRIFIKNLIFRKITYDPGSIAFKSLEFWQDKANTT